MARQQPEDELFPWEQPVPTDPNVANNRAAIVRGAAGGAIPWAIPWAIRMGSGFGSFMGAGMGAGISGAGEVLAQAIERGTVDPRELNWKRVGFESALGAIPGAKLVKPGFLKSAGIGAGLATGGLAGRKLTADTPEEAAIDPRSDLIQIGLGGLAGGTMGKIIEKFSRKAPTPPPGSTTPPKPLTLDDWLRKNDYKPEEIESQALRAEGLAVVDPTHLKAGRDTADAIRQSAIRAGKAGDSTTKAVLTGQKADIRQEATNLNKRDQFIEKQWQQEGRNANATQKYLDGVAKETDKQSLQIEADRMKAWMQEAKNANAAEAYERAQANAAAVQKRLDELTAQGATAETTVSTTSKTQTPDADVSARTVIRAAGEEGGAPPPSGPKEPRTTNPGPLELSGKRRMSPDRTRAVTGMDPEEAVARGLAIADGEGYRLNPKYRPTTAGPAAPEAPAAAPIAPKPGVFQIIRPNGKIVEATDKETAVALAKASGQGTVVVPPAKAPKTRVPKGPKPVTGSAKTIAEQQAPAAGPKETALKDTTTGTDQLEALEQQLGREIPPPAGGKGTLPPEEPPAPAPAPAPAPKPKGPAVAAAEVPPVGGVKLSSPLAFRVAEAQGSVPEGSAIMRFFRTREAANKAGAYTEELPEETIGLMNSLLGRAEVAPPQPKGARKTEDPSGLWNMIRQISKELNLPQFPRGATVRPNFKHVPESIRPTPASTAPVIDTTPAPKGPKGMKVQAAAPKAPEAPPAAPEAPPTAPQGPRQESFPTGRDPEYADLQTKLQANEARLRELQSGQGIQPLEGTARPIPAQLQSRINTAQSRLQILQNEGQGDSPEAMKLVQELEQLQWERFATEYPDLAAQLAKAEEASAKAPKGKGRKKVGPPKISANPLFDPEAYRWAAEQLGPEGIGALAGGGIGAMTAEDPLMGALVGAGLGYGGGRYLQSIGDSNKPFVHIDPENPKESIARLGSGFQRFNYLLDPFTIGINTGPAPVGAGVMGAIEKGTTGRVQQLFNQPEAAQNIEQGGDMLKSLLGSRGVWSGDRWQNAWDEARGLIGRAERAEELPNESLDKLRELFSGPGRMLTTGDVVVRGSLIEAGVPEDIARAITLTSNPRYKHIGEPIVNFAKSAMGGILLPFSRTPANVLEGGLERTPLLGYFFNLTNDPDVKATFTEMTTRQGLGAGMWYLGYLAGQHIDQETDDAYKLRRLITNMGGQYGLPIGAGYAAGQAVRDGVISGDMNSISAALGSLRDFIQQGGSQINQAFPLPTTEGFEDIWGMSNWLAGEPIHPEAETWSRQWLPRPLTPGIVPYLEDVAQQAQDVLPWEN